MKLRKWKPQYDRLAGQFAKYHFGGWGGMIRLFSSDRALSLKWHDKEYDPVDVLFVKKMANEYHGLERYAHQYHVSAMYDYAYHHWLMAAAWRKENMELNNFGDEKHLHAVDFDLRCASYNLALHDWFDSRGKIRKVMPQPHHFRLKSDIIKSKDKRSSEELAAVYEKLQV